MVPDAPRGAPEPAGLLPGSLRVAGAVTLAGCVVTAVLAAILAGSAAQGWLDSPADARIQAALGHAPVLLQWLPKFGTLKPAALLTVALVVLFAATRRWSGAALAALAVPAATGLTEYMLKPTVGALVDQGFPSGHATVMFALAAIWAIWLGGPARRWVPGQFRLLLALLGVLLAAAVGAAMIAIAAHTLTDVVAGAAVGLGVVLAGALSLDLATSRVRREPAGRSEPAG